MPGVAEVAALGGFVAQYQVSVDPNRLKAHDVSIADVTRAIRDSNQEVGGRLLELAGREYMVRGRGYLRSREDLEQVVVRTGAGEPPVLVRDVGAVALGPELRRGVSDLDGLGDTVGGIVVMRQGENPREVIRRVKARLEELKPSLPHSVRIVTTYDRSELIQRAIDTLKHELLLEVAIVSLVILVFLWHIPSAIVPILTIPIAVLLAFIPMALLGISSNIMSLAGIAISIGVLVDGAIVEVENAYKKLELWERGGRQRRLPRRAAGGAARGRPGRLLLAAGDRGGVPADLHAARSGGPALQAAGLDQEPQHGDRRGAGAHARSRAAHVVHAHGLRQLPPALARLARQPGDGRALPSGGEASDQPRAVRRLRAGLPLRAALAEGHGRWRRC